MPGGVRWCRNNLRGVDSILLGWALATQKDNPPPDLLIYHHYPYCALSNEKPNGEDHCCKCSLQLGEAANAVFFNICWELLQSHPVKFCDAGSCCTSESNENRDNEECELMRTSESNENHDNEEYELGQPLRQGASSPDCQKWCCCGKCQPTQKYHEQLCCRRKKGQCITTSHWFQQLVLSSPTLKKALLYKDPFLDLTDGNIDNQLHHLLTSNTFTGALALSIWKTELSSQAAAGGKLEILIPKQSTLYWF